MDVRTNNSNKLEYYPEQIINSWIVGNFAAERNKNGRSFESDKHSKKL